MDELLKPKLLLHVCCAPCSTHSIEVLKRDYDLALFFSNSNIYPKEEYERRLKNAKKIADIHGIPLIEDSYDHDAWLDHISGLESEPEKGKRCEKCFGFSLGRTSDCQKAEGFDLFTTTLTISPHKDSKKIFEIANKLGDFLEIDLKKKDGFSHSIGLSKKHNLYRQDYCGCEFSMR
jgi:hypothetical protein